MDDRRKGIRTLVGDFKARTGKLGGWVEWKDERGEEGGRRSRDRKVNKEGRELINGLEEAGWYIFNGCGKGDEESDWTYAGGRGEFVLDYVIRDEEVWERVKRVKVEDKIESGHFLVVMWIKGGERGSEGKGREEEEIEVDRG